ncbi:hypothetical protein TRVA0_004S02740 [Trichomonascus vanleenenianus]|uniref:histone-fold domain-containing protein n=1 Tax=Trichomonascus vanleenenianus TaxID=2268995 RepID=UPI003ECB6949
MSEENSNITEDIVIIDKTKEEEEEEDSMVVPTIPLARVKRIIKQDDEVVTVSSGAVYAIATATELFANYFAEQAYLSAQADKRKKLQYQDFATAVANIDQLEFLADIVPKKVPYRKVVEHQKAASSVQIDKNQTTLKFGADGQIGLDEPKKVPILTDDKEPAKVPLMIDEDS